MKRKEADAVSEYTLHLTREENITLGAGAVRRLIEGRNGDAALLYLCLARRGASEPEQLRAELGWSEAEFSAAERALRAMGLVGPGEEAEPAQPAQKPAPPAPENAAPEYSREDVMRKLESDGAFSAVLREVERKLGRLSDPSVRKLLGLYDYLGLPADVLLLLVNYCAERKAEQFGQGRLPTMREIEKEGYRWAQWELFSSAAADAYLQSERRKRDSFPAYLSALGIRDRAAVPSEEKYLRAWSEMGFPPETVAVAYDKTVLRCGEFKWPYCNGILKRWHEKGLHTPDEVRAEHKPRETAPAQDEDAWMDEFIK